MMLGADFMLRQQHVLDKRRQATVVTVQVVGKGRLQKPRRIFTLDLAFG
jgi:hypothetical protein